MAIAPTGAGSTGAGISTIQNFVTAIITFINSYLIPLLFAVAFLMFLYGAFRFFILGTSRGDEEAVTQGRQFMIWSVVGFVLMFSLWGIVALVRNTFQLTGTQPPIPTLNTSGSASSGGTSPLAPPSSTPSPAPGQTSPAPVPGQYTGIGPQQ